MNPIHQASAGEFLPPSPEQKTGRASAKLIVLEGLDGSGKGTQTALLRDALQTEGKTVRELDFPRYGTVGASLVELYLSGGLGGSPFDTNAYASSLFYAADRYVSFRREWGADYANPHAVLLANRYTTANAYHQLAKLSPAEYEPFLAWLWDFEYGKLGLPKPDVVLLLDMPVSLSMKLVERRGNGKDIHEKDKAYLELCRRAALYVAEACGWRVIPCGEEGADAPYSPEEIHRAVRKETEKILSL